MAEPRDAVVSLRISEEEHGQLRQAAEARGVTVSALVRTIVLREVASNPRAAETKTTALGAHAEAGHGIFWDAVSSANIAGGTLTVSLAIGQDVDA
jgi:hypothetical protein